MFFKIHHRAIALALKLLQPWIWLQDKSLLRNHINLVHFFIFFYFSWPVVRGHQNQQSVLLGQTECSQRNQAIYTCCFTVWKDKYHSLHSQGMFTFDSSYLFCRSLSFELRFFFIFYALALKVIAVFYGQRTYIFMLTHLSRMNGSFCIWM